MKDRVAPRTEAENAEFFGALERLYDSSVKLNEFAERLRSAVGRERGIAAEAIQCELRNYREGRVSG